MFNFDNTLFNNLLLEAGSSNRKRAHYCIHKDHSEPVQKVCIALKSGTYVRPHRHTDESGWEMFMVLKGRVAMLIFDNEGYVQRRIIMSPGSECAGIELEPNTWHTVFPMDLEAVIFEIKEGPFSAKKESDFADWAPEEGSEDVEAFLNWAKSSEINDNFLESNKG